MAWVNSLSPHAQAALIAALVTLFSILIKDLLIARWQEDKRAKKLSKTFDVIGFGAFESMWLSENTQEKRLLVRLNEIIDDLDVSINDNCRVKQLKKIFQATAKLVTALAQISISRETFSTKTLRLAEKASAEDQMRSII